MRPFCPRVNFELCPTGPFTAPAVKPLRRHLDGTTGCHSQPGPRTEVEAHWK